MISLAILLYGIFAFLAFGKLPLTFFQQDEWAIFGNYLYWQKEQLSWWNRLFIYEQDTHIVPISNFLSYLQYYLFGLSFPFYAIVSISIHAVNALLIYYLTTLFVRNKFIGFLAGLFFLTNSITQQAITWVATTTGTAGSTLLVLLSIVFFMRFLRRGEKKTDILLSVFFLAISLLMKETSIFCFVFFPILWFLYGKKKNVFSMIKTFSPFFVLGITYILFRLYFLLFGYHSTSVAEELSQPNILIYIFRIVTFPLKFIAQSFIPVPYIIALGSTMVLLGYPHFVLGGTSDPYVVETVASDIVSYVVAFVIIGLSVFTYRIKVIHKIGIHKVAIASVLFISLSSLPFIFIPGKGGYLSLIDGRHLYLTSIFSSILLSVLVLVAYRVLGRKKILLVGFFVVLYIGMNMMVIRKALNIQMGIAFTRQQILKTIYTLYPHLPPKVIFYVESNTAFYGLPDEEKILPFQSGFGQTLLVWYNDHGENIPSCFFQSKYLYVLLSQDYKECGGRGFGYYRNINLLKESLAANNLYAKNVIAFRYNSFTNSVIDITKELQNKLQ